MPQLNSLRALAVIGVIVSHYLPQTKILIDTGTLGVFLFFVLSGFLITSVLLRSKTSLEGGASFGNVLARFYTRRFLRIFPIYYLMLAILWLVNMPQIRAALPWHLGYLTNFLIFMRPGTVGAAGHFWSLAVEEQFYLFWPLVIILSPRKYLTHIVLVVIVFAPIFKIVATLWGEPFSLRYLPLSCLDTLGMGALLAVAADRQSFLRAERLRDLGFYIGVPLLLISILIAHLSANLLLFNTIQDLAIGLCSVWLVAGAATGFGGFGAKLLEQRLLINIGVISYGIYIFHNFMPTAFRMMQGLGVPFLGTLGNAILMTIAVIILAALSWVVYERPINKMKRFFPYAR